MATARPRRTSRSAAVSWKQATLAPIVVVKGTEDLLVERAVTSLRRQALAVDPNTEISLIDAATYRGHQLIDLTAPSLFGENRFIIVEHAEGMTDAFLDDMLSYVAEPDPEVTVVLRHGGGNRGKKLLDAIAHASYPLVACEQLKNTRDKAAFITEDVRSAGRSIDADAVAALVDALGSDLRELVSATEQLLADIPGTITLEHVNTYYAGRFEAKGYAVADALVEGNTARTITLLRHSIATGTQPVQIVSSMAAKIRQLAQVSALGSGAARELGMPPWQVDRARRELRNWSDEALAQALIDLAEADYGTKGGSKDPVYAIERAVISIARTRYRYPRRR